MKLQRNAQKRMIDIHRGEKDEKARTDEARAAVKEILAAMPESTKKALGDNRRALRGGARRGFNNAWFRFFLTLRSAPNVLRKVSGARSWQLTARRTCKSRRRKTSRRSRRPSRPAATGSQDGRAPRVESPLPALQNRLSQRVCRDRDDHGSRSTQDHWGLDRRTHGGKVDRVLNDKRPLTPIPLK